MLSPTPGDEAAFMEADGRRLHYRLAGVHPGEAPLLFLHEGLGSVELWRDFPDDLVDACGRQGFLYSRYGNGWSDPLTEPRLPDYMHDEALRSLPEIVDRVAPRPPVLVGHSDGASIALIYAGSGHPVEALVLLAPHVFTEPGGLASIAAVRDRFPTSDLPDKMARYHADPEATFYGWADVWLSQAFQTWNIEEYLPAINCPILLVQGDEDEYGTTSQLDAIERSVGGPVERLLVGGAKHAPHLAEPALVTETTARFISGLWA